MLTLAARLTLMFATASSLVVLVGTNANAQNLRGGETRFQAVATGEERTSQSGLWVMDVYYKPMRMIPVELTDPKTGHKRSEFVHYIVYRGFNHKLETKETDTVAVNEMDKPVAPQQFIPEAILVVTDNDRHEIYPDQVIPEALAAINKREKGNYKSSVGIVGSIPESSEPGSPEDVAVEGVFTWRGINPDANRYSVFMMGFSNGIRKVDGTDGSPIFQTKAIMQKYWRRGDRFDQREFEIILDGETQWIYR